MSESEHLSASLAAAELLALLALRSQRLELLALHSQRSELRSFSLAAASPPDVRRGYASPEAPFSLWGSAPLGRSPDLNLTMPGEAQPRLTSGGEAAAEDPDQARGRGIRSGF